MHRQRGGERIELHRAAALRALGRLPRVLQPQITSIQHSYTLNQIQNAYNFFF